MVVDSNEEDTRNDLHRSDTAGSIDLSLDINNVKIKKIYISRW